ncbi:MAG: T9SS type A sorting domain-containing protein [Reichenbachiella sp.]
MMKKGILLLIIGIQLISNAYAQHSVARLWNEALLEAIRNDFARPTVHARNLFHISAAMYDAWASYDEISETYLLANEMNGYISIFTGIPAPIDVLLARQKAISFAAYRLLTYRFINSPGQPTTQILFDQLMDDLGYDKSFRGIQYEGGNPAALGNYIAQTYIEFGVIDNSNERNDYANLFYEPFNEPLMPFDPGNKTLTDPNRWQPLIFETFIDQSGNVIPGNIPEFLGPEWGSVFPFALKNSDRNIYERDGESYWVYHDPGAPPFLNQQEDTEESAQYKWGFAMVAAWSGQLDPSDGVMIDISPASNGNNHTLPDTFDQYPDFYNLLDGGDASPGHSVNPITGEPYEPQIVPRGDYARVLAEFWADGPASETPPGHWFTILNYVSDHPLLEKKFKGEGSVLSDLEWDIKAYFILSGTMHDAAIASWGVKGWYDYLRPISAIRYMSDKGQSSDPSLTNYHIEGIPLIDGYIEVVDEEDALVGANKENEGKIKLYAWRGHAYILDTDSDQAGVDWILAENWWPYQRISFVTPPFAGFVSGHSTFSRAAAEVMTLLTGDPYFPGGMGEFEAKKNEFLVFEEGPSVDLTLQWATYVDASDQTSLSRIWGGIHPPADDIPGRKMGISIGKDAFELAERYFKGTVLSINDDLLNSIAVYPNPLTSEKALNISGVNRNSGIVILNLQGQIIKSYETSNQNSSSNIKIDVSNLNAGIYILRVNQWSYRIIIE